MRREAGQQRGHAWPGDHVVRLQTSTGRSYASDGARLPLQLYSSNFCRTRVGARGPQGALHDCETRPDHKWSWQIVMSLRDAPTDENLRFTQQERTLKGQRGSSALPRTTPGDGPTKTLQGPFLP